MDEMPKLALTDWAKLPDAVAFGHCESTDLAPYDQARYLFSVMEVARQDSVNVLVVFESQTLSAELARFPDP
ncbi:hypothetical protein J3459_011969 [Metarhizium acridum]|nr:hypothetical protein J3459_011969 [Metarhizium acridum]